MRGLQAVEAQEQGTATMEVELSHADVEGNWTRDGLRLQPGPNCQLAVHGATHTLTLSRLQRQDGGLVAFRTEGVHTSAHLVVTGGCLWVGQHSLQGSCIGEGNGNPLQCSCLENPRVASAPLSPSLWT